MCSLLLNNIYRVLVGKQEGKTTLGRPRCRWKDNIKIYLKEMGWGGVVCCGVVWTGYIWLRTSGGLLNMVPSGAIKYWEILDWLSDWWLLKRTHLHGVSHLAQVSNRFGYMGRL
jgi:hypothetical protein